MNTKISHSNQGLFLPNFLFNIFLVYVVYFVCRIEFYLENINMFSVTFGSKDWWNIMRGGLLFDTSAICYTNCLYFLLIIFPLHWKEHRIFHLICKWIFVVINSICLFINLCDSVYFPFSFHRVTSRVFNEFANETNLFKIFGYEFIHHWYLVLLAALLIFFLWKCYRSLLTEKHPIATYYLWRIPAFIIIVILTIFGMRGSFGYTWTRPINVGTAYQYTTRSAETAIALNTPFSLIRTYDKRPYPATQFYTDDELNALYSPIHQPIDSIPVQKKNVVILIVESFAKEFVGALNTNLDNGTYRGYTPFIDSLIQQSLTFDHTYCNTNTSIDAMPAVFASIPLMEKSFIGSPYALNKITALPNLLQAWGYHTAFFHGAPNGSMGFLAFAQQAGFEKYYGMDEYKADPNFHGDADFDGTWAIWDEEFLQYYAREMNHMQEPFFTACFTASSHHPFALPERYKEVFLEEGKYPLHKCIKYADYSLRRFFETASKQPWFQNTLFVITADHASSRTTHELYKTDHGNCLVPIIIYDPCESHPKGIQHGTMQQLDILPTLLGMLGYDKSYFSFGSDVLHDAPVNAFGFNWLNTPCYIYNDYFLQALTDGTVIALYNIAEDPACQHDLSQTDTPETREVIRRYKAFIQCFLTRMANDDIKIK